jgi:hypothetical protein
LRAIPTTVVERPLRGLVGVIVLGTLTVGVVDDDEVGLAGVEEGVAGVGATVPGWAPPVGVVGVGVVAAGVLVAGVDVAGVVVVELWTCSDAGIGNPSFELVVVVWLLVLAAIAPAGRIAAREHASNTHRPPTRARVVPL